MLVNVYRNSSGLIYEVVQNSEKDLMYYNAPMHYIFLGKYDKKFILPKQKVKKTHTEQVRFLRLSGNGLLEASIIVPTDAQNVKVSYDIEEEE